MIAFSGILMHLTYPKSWIQEARDKAQPGKAEEEDFDWRQRVRSAEGWNLVGKKFGDDWAMVWEEILIGFTVAGFMAVLVPATFWATIFLVDFGDSLPSWLIVLENAAVAPFVAAATFIGSMGNIPLATVLNTNGVLFAGIMGYIYSDLMVPPLVQVNAGYYGWRMALYIAGVMYVSIVTTALTLNGTFALIDIVPEGRKAVSQIAQFDLGYTFWMNLASVTIVVVMVALRRRHRESRQHHGDYDHDGMDHGGGFSPKRVIAYVCIGVLACGFAAYGLTTLW